MKLKKTREYQATDVQGTRDSAALEQRKGAIIYSYWTFDFYGFACRVEDIAFQFATKSPPCILVGRYFMEHTEEEIEETVAKDINGGRPFQKEQEGLYRVPFSCL